MSQKFEEIKECALSHLSELDKDALMNLTARMLAEVICEKLSLGENAMEAEDYKALKEWFREYVFKIATDDAEEEEDDDDDDDDNDEDISDDEEDVMAIPEEVKNASEEWKKSYKTVCFAQGTSKFPWWPVYIFDPSTMDPGGLRDGALKEIEKKHIVYYYGCDAKSAFNYVPAKNISPYNEETLKLYKDQKMNKKLEMRFEEGLKLAATDSKLKPDERASIMVDKFAKRLATLSKQQEKRRKQKIRERKAQVKTAKEAKKRKTTTKTTKSKATTKGKNTTTTAKAKSKAPMKKTKAATKQKKTTKAKRTKKTDTEEEEIDDDVEEDDGKMEVEKEKDEVVEIPEEEEEEEDDDDDDDDEDYEADTSKPADKMKEKAATKSTKSTSKSSLSDSESDSESKKKKEEAKKAKADAKEKKKEKEKAEAKKKSENLAKQKKEEKERVEQRKQQILQQESKVDRAKRLTSLLGLHSKRGGAADIDKCVKTLDKLDKMDLNLEELKQSEAALILNSLKKHTNANLAKAAGDLRSKWKQMFIKPPAPPTTNVSSTDANPPVPPSSDDKEDEVSSTTKRKRVVVDDDDDDDGDDTEKNSNSHNTTTTTNNNNNNNNSSSSKKTKQEEEVVVELKVYEIGCRNIALKMFQSVFTNNIKLINDLEALVWDLFEGKPQSEFTSAVQWLMIHCKTISSNKISITDDNKDAIRSAIEKRSKEDLKSSF